MGSKTEGQRLDYILSQRPKLHSNQVCIVDDGRGMMDAARDAASQ
jgi:hypothetical protein